MGNHTEQFEGQQQTEAKSFNASFQNYTTERMDIKLTARDMQSKTDDLVSKNVLPEIALFDDVKPPADVKPDYGNRQVTSEDVKDYGIKCEHSNKDGTEHSKVEFPNGVSVEKSHDSAPRVGDKPNIQVESGITIIDGAKEKVFGSGEFFDKDGKEVAKINPDGSVTVDGGKGKFFTIETDGTVTKASVTRSPDGKTFDVWNTDVPLGDMRPSSNGQH